LLKDTTHIRHKSKKVSNNAKLEKFI
jgi:hypothetical protein